MDRDNTIARLENIAKHAVHTAGEDIFILNLDDGIAIHEAIEALKAQLSQEGTTKDTISRQAAIDAINSWRGRFSEEYNEAIDDCENSIKELPSAQPEYEEVTPEEAASEIASGSMMSAWSWLNVIIQLKQMGYAICRKR